MVKVLMLVEGQTEERFIKKLLGPHLGIKKNSKGQPQGIAPT